MSFDEQLDAKLKAIARMAAPGPSIADDVMNRLVQEKREPETTTGQTNKAPGAGRHRPRWMTSWRIGFPVAAAIGVAAGLLLGVGLSRMGSAPRVESPSGRPVPIQVAGLKGTVLVKRSPNAAWNELTSSSPLYVGDVFQASPKSELTLSFQDGSALVLSANSRLALDHYNGGVRLNLGAGVMKASLNSPHPPFIVSTPSGQLEALGTEFTVSVE